MFKINGFLPEKQDDKADLTTNSQFGGVIIWIFIMVALFAALNYAVSKGSRTGAATITAEQAKLAAQEILDYGRLMKQTVQQLQINGCSDTQISFENSTSGIYTNPNAPPDKTCNVFDAAGGGMKMRLIPESIRGLTTSDYPRFAGNTILSNMGTTNPGLHLWIRTINKDACMAFNKFVGIDNVTDDAPTEGGFLTSVLFVGTYNTSTTFGDDNNGANFLGHESGCHKDSSEVDVNGNPFYDYYYVLIVR